MATIKTPYHPVFEELKREDGRICAYTFVANLEVILGHFRAAHIKEVHTEEEWLNLLANHDPLIKVAR